MIESDVSSASSALGMQGPASSALGMQGPLLPPRAPIVYMPHQEAGVRWMLAREDEGAVVCRGGILADDMGLGKTFQTIGLLCNTSYALRTLIICPPALIAGWTDELKACGYGVSVMVKASWTKVSAAEKTVWLTTYAKACLYRKALATAEPAFERVVLDEGHVIRNMKTTRWRNCMAIGLRAKCRWILSATPIQNGSSDWLSLCYWLRVRGVSDKLIMELSPTLMLRRTMAELPGMPPAPRFIDREFLIAEGTEEGRLFRVLCDNAEAAADATASIKLERWMRIQQFLIHPQVYIDAMLAKGMVVSDWSGGATKWAACMSDIADGIRLNESTIVFCNFRAEMDRVVVAAEEMGAVVCCVRGGMGADAVGMSVRRGREAAAAGKAVVMVIQIVSGGAGLNLQFCRRILFLSQHWNPAVVHQAVGRAVRIGQSACVDVVFYSVVDDVLDNIDVRMRELHGLKIQGAKEVCETLFQGYRPL